MIEHQTTTGLETPQQEDPAYVAAMIAKAEGTPIAPEEPVTPTVDTNKVLAGKYKTVEELEKGYLELQKAYSSKKPPVATPIETETTPEVNPLVIPTEETADDTTDTTDTATEVLESKGLDIDTYNAEWQETGGLSEESYSSLEKAGIPKEMVDAYIEGQELKASLAITRVYDTAGGEQEYKQLLTWANDNLPATEVSAYNDVMQSGDINQIVLAARGLRATYEDKHGHAPQLITGEASGDPQESTGSYSSKAQMMADMSDPRYSRDAAFRKQVESKVQRSNLF